MDLVVCIITIIIILSSFKRLANCTISASLVVSNVFHILRLRQLSWQICLFVCYAY